MPQLLTEQRQSKTEMSRRVTNSTKKKIAANQRWNCNICQNLLDETYEVDHILPLKDEGTNEENNLQALCPNCHRKKTNKEMSRPKKKNNTLSPLVVVIVAQQTRNNSTSAPKGKEKIQLPQWWYNEEDGNDMSRLHKANIKHYYPQLDWNVVKNTNLNSYTLNELKLILCARTGRVKNNSKNELIKEIREDAEKIEKAADDMMNIDWCRR